MANVSSIIAPLRHERDRVEKQLSGLNAALTAFAGVLECSLKTARQSPPKRDFCLRANYFPAR